MRFLVANSWRYLIIVLGGYFICCAHVGHLQRNTIPQACQLLDSLYANAFINPPFTMRGKVRFDIEQRRLKGAYELVVSRPHVDSLSGEGENAGTSNSKRRFRGGDKAFSFVGSTLFGAGREDLSVFLADGYLMVLDRERDEYFEGEEAEDMIRENLGLGDDFEKIIDIALGDWEPCLDKSIILLQPENNGRVFSGKSTKGDFHIDLSGPHGKLRETTWPLELSDGKMEVLRVQYRWSRGEEGLESIILSLEGRKWRIKLTVSEILN